MKKNIALIIAIALLIIFVGCSAINTTSEKNTDEYTYTIGVAKDFPPFSYTNDIGEETGIDVDIIKAVAQDQGFQIKFESMDYNEAVQKLNDDQIAGYMGNAYVTDEGSEEFNFSDSYFESGIICAVKNDSNIDSYEALNGQKVGVLNNTESATYANSIKDNYHFEIVNYNNEEELFTALENGEITALFDNYSSVGFAIKQGKPFKTFGSLEDVNNYCLMARLGDVQSQVLLDKFNAGLKNIKDNGTYQKIIDEYLPAN